MKTAIVTGGGRGIGLEITRTFVEAGYHVLVGSRNESGQLKQLGELCRFQPTDVTSPAQVARLVESAIAWTGGVDVLVNNAGNSAWRPLAKIDEGFWQDMIDRNLKSVLFATQAAVGRMADGGSVINVSSLAGKRGSANNSVYCAAKFGVNGLTQSLAKELGPRGIRVNAVCPVYVRTDGLNRALTDLAAPPSGGDVDQYLRDFSRTQAALGRLPEAREIAQTCLFLASEHASAVTGQCLNVDCGVLPQ